MTTARKIIALFALLLLLPVESSAADSFWSHIKMRARESYELFNVKAAGQNVGYRGFTNTFNLFYEKPMEYSIGLAGGSIFTGLSTDDTPITGFSDEMSTTFIGLEAKYFPSRSLKGFFIRPGLYLKTLDTGGSLGSQDGLMGGAGVGYEFPVYGNIHLVPEIGTQFGDLGGYSVEIFSFSLALHFYSL